MFWSTVGYFFALKAKEARKVLKLVLPWIAVGVGFLLPGFLAASFEFPFRIGSAEDWRCFPFWMQIVNNGIFWGLAFALVLIGVLIYILYNALRKPFREIREYGVGKFLKDAGGDLWRGTREHKEVLVFWLTSPSTGFLTLYLLNRAGHLDRFATDPLSTTLVVGTVAGIMVNFAILIIIVIFWCIGKFLKNNWQEAQRLAKEKENKKSKEQ